LRAAAVCGLAAFVTSAEVTVEAAELSDIICPSATESPPTPPLGAAMPYRPQELERHWPQTWICKAHNEVLANLAMAQVGQEGDPRTGKQSYTIQPLPRADPSPPTRWHARLSWKLYLSIHPGEQAPATLLVKAEYEQPSIARFDMFVSLTTKGIRGVASQVIDEAASEACLEARNDCTHREEIMLEIPRDALRRAVSTGLLVDLMGHGRTERLAIRKEFIRALNEKAQVR
jgi:hypothetical protein